MKQILTVSALLAIGLNAAIFGFFYAWICSTMWGLDAADSKTAIAAMQAMNASVRNATFAPAFFGTPVALLLVAILAKRENLTQVGLLFGEAALVYFTGGLILTMVVNVPMNNALATIQIPENISEAKVIWQNYSAPWQFWNITRTVFSGLSLLLALIGLHQLGTANVAQHHKPA